MFFFALFALELTSASTQRRLLDLEAANPTNTTQRSDDYPFMLGRGYDLSVANLWDFSSGLSSKQILDMQDLPASCARADDSCVHISKTELRKFSSVKDAFNMFTQSSAMSFTASYYDVAASLSAAWGSLGSGSWFSESYGTMGLSKEVKRCHSLETGCLKANHGDIRALTRFTDAISKTGHDDIHGCDRDVMDYWRAVVIKQFGTHMATQTRNGGMMRYEEMANFDGTDDQECMFDSVCANMRLAGFDDIKAKFGMCSNSTSCAGANTEDASITYKCVAVGGADMSGLPDVMVPVCQGASHQEMVGDIVKLTTYEGNNDREKDVSCCAKCAENPDCEFWVRSTHTNACWLKKNFKSYEERSVRRGAHRTTKYEPQPQTMCNSRTTLPNRKKFFNPTDEDLNSDLTVVGMDFMEIENLAQAYGATYEVTATIAKAREYHMCRALPDTVWQWRTDGCDKGSGEGKCTCVRKCENGGTLDEATCTCKCRGDSMHGWKGETCTETYGTCQPGAGTGNPRAARKCPQSGHCASAFHGYHCGPTEVCCITDFHGACCPFGSSCNCGVSHCSCRTPRDTFLAVIAPESTPATYTKLENVSCKKSKLKMRKKGPNGPETTFKTFNFQKAKDTCDKLDNCVGVMDSGCDGEGKYVLCTESEKAFKSKPGTCIHIKET